MNSKRITSLAMLIALYSVLSILTPIKIENFKFTFEAFPILVASLLLGPMDGLIVGGVGSFIYQLLFSGYGLTATTILWVLPHAISGLIVGLYAKIKKFNFKKKELIFIACLSALIVTILNSLAIYIDAKVYGYYYFGIVIGGILYKVLTGIILALIYTQVLEKLLVFLKKKIEYGEQK